MTSTNRNLRWMKRSLLASAAACILLASPSARADYQLEATIKMPGQKISWDYLTFDKVNRKLYIARQVVGMTVYSPDDNKILGDIEKAGGAHGAAFVQDAGRGYTSNDDGTSAVFDLKTMKLITTIKDGDDNDANVYDPASKNVFFINADAGTATAVDGASGKVGGKLPLNSKSPEFPSVDGTGKMFIAIRDKDQVAAFDTKEMKEIGRWATAPCKLPTATAIDPSTHRLFLGCRGDAPVLAVMNTDTGAIVASVKTGRGTDAATYDPETKKIFVASGIDANVTVVQQKSADEYAVVETIATKPLARTIALDPKTKKIYLVTGEQLPAQPGARPLFKPDSFQLLIYAPK
jgi:DNA-binding beta-propeller fold protein YncE